MTLGPKVLTKHPPLSRWSSVDEHSHGRTDTSIENDIKKTLGDVGKSLSLDTSSLKDDHVLKSCTLKKLIKRRAHLKRCDKQDTYGHNTAEYDTIRERVMQERSVKHAIEALQERGRMLKYMYDDCVHLNEGRQQRKQNEIFMKRQTELIILMVLFCAFCILIVIPSYVRIISYQHE